VLVARGEGGAGATRLPNERKKTVQERKCLPTGKITVGRANPYWGHKSSSN